MDNGTALQTPTRHASAPVRHLTWLVAGILVLMVLYTLYFAATLLLPITLALLFSLLLSPPVRWLTVLRIPPPVGAAVVMLVLLGGVGQGIYLLSGPAGEWLDKAPHSFREVEWKLRALKKPIEEVQKATQQVEKLTVLEDGDKTVEVEVKEPSLTRTLISSTPIVLAELGVCVVLLYFLLASGDNFLRKLVRVIPRLQDKRRAVEIARRIQHDISSYLFTIALINAGLGVAVGTALYFLDMPNPALWGAMAAALNFAPYLGAIVGVVVVGMAAMLSFNDLSQAALVPAVYLGLTTLEGQVVTPLIVGRRLAISPVVVFLGITVWGWLWGIPGVLLAVPLLAIFKIICEQLEPLQGIAEFLGN